MFFGRTHKFGRDETTTFIWYESFRIFWTEQTSRLSPHNNNNNEAGGGGSYIYTPSPPFGNFLFGNFRVCVVARCVYFDAMVDPKCRRSRFLAVESCCFLDLCIRVERMADERVCMVLCDGGFALRRFQCLRNESHSCVPNVEGLFPSDPISSCLNSAVGSVDRTKVGEAHVLPSACHLQFQG